MSGNSWPQIGAFLGDWSGDGRALHLTLVVDNNSGIVLKVDECSVLASPGLSLSNNYSWHD